MSTDVEVPDTIARPLKPSEAQAARRYVKNSYEALRTDLAAFRDEQIQQVTERVRKDFADSLRQAEEIEKAAMRSAKKALKKRDALIREAKDQGLRASHRMVSAADLAVSVRVPDLDTLVEKATREVRNAYSRAMNDIRAAELAAEKVILIASMTTETEQVVRSIPTAEQAMRLRMAEMPTIASLGLTEG